MKHLWIAMGLCAFLAAPVRAGAQGGDEPKPEKPQKGSADKKKSGQGDTDGKKGAKDR